MRILSVSKRPVICQGCREKFVREPGNYEKDTKGFYHKACHNQMLQDRAGREDLLDMVRETIGPTVNLAFVQKQVKKFTEQYGYTVSGIKGTIYYVTQIKRQRLKPEFGLAFVPYNYEKARVYFEKMEGMDEIEPFKEAEIREVTIREPQRLKKGLEVDLESLFEEGEL